MLITKEVEVNITNRNKGYYNELNYNCNNGDIIKIDVKDLFKGSTIVVECLCDYCLKEGINTITPKKFNEYNKERENFASDSCYKCGHKKEYDILKYKNDNGLLSIADRRYFTFKENRLKELKNHIDTFGTITNLRKFNKRLYSEILRNKETPTSLAIEIGYNIMDICSKLTPHYFDDWDKFELVLRELIKKFNRFPTQAEITKELCIGQQHINRHGGIYEIKRKLNHIDTGDLIDDNGYYNNSSYEYILSQWFIHNTNVDIRRNVLISDNPVIDGNYNCDFVLLLPDNNKLWVEIWGGYRNNQKSNTFHNYNNTHDIKMNLYNKYQHKLISLYPEFFDNKKYDSIQIALYELFSDKIECKHKSIDVEKIIPYSLVNEQEIINQVLSYSKNDSYLPLGKIINKVNNRLMKEIVKRYGNYGEFSEKIGIPMEFKKNKFWNEDKILEYFNLIHSKYNKLLNRPEIINLKDNCNLCKDLSGIIYVINRYGGLINLQLKYLINNINKINSNDIIYLNKVINKKTKGIKQEHQIIAQEILEIYNTNIA